MRAVRWQCNRDPFIDARRDGAACLSAVAAARFAARPLWGSFWCAARMRSGLPLAGAQRCFQFPAQAFGFLFQALDLFAQPLVFLLRSIELLFRNKFNALRWLVCGEPTNGFHPTLRYAKPHLLSSKIFERPISEPHQAGKQIRLVNTCVITNNVKRLVEFYEPILLLKATKSGEDYAEFPSDAGVLAIFSAVAQERYIPGSTEATKNRSVILVRSTGDYRTL